MLKSRGIRNADWLDDTIVTVERKLPQQFVQQNMFDKQEKKL